MAVFLLNTCKFNGCGLTFSNLSDLILHIEENHIDCDPHILEQKESQQPTAVPLSYVLKFYTDVTKKENCSNSDFKTQETFKTVTKQLVQDDSSISVVNTSCLTSSASYFTPSGTVGSEGDENDIMTDSEDSNDSWTTQQEFSPEFILKYGSKVINGVPGDEKPFACPVPGCKKRYKNVNGIKYHAKNGHRKDAKIRKAFKCHCGKSYKTAQGLKNHTNIQHQGMSLTTISTQSGEFLQIPTSQLTTIQPIRTVAVSGATIKQLSLGALLGSGTTTQLTTVPLKTLSGNKLNGAQITGVVVNKVSSSEPQLQARTLRELLCLPTTPTNILTKVPKFQHTSLQSKSNTLAADTLDVGGITKINSSNVSLPPTPVTPPDTQLTFTPLEDHLSMSPPHFPPSPNSSDIEITL